MRLNRFHLPDAVPGALMPLPDDEAGHATRVLRLRSGAAVRVFDGCGHEYAAAVRTVGRSGVTVEVEQEVLPPSAEAGVALTLVVAVLKGDHMDAVVRDATMLGVVAVQPVLTERTEVPASVAGAGNRRERWQRVAVSSTKQCGRAVVPAVLAPVDLQALVKAWEAGGAPGARLACVEPSAPVEAVTARDVAMPAGGAATLVVGPEGGWAEDELRLMGPQCRFIRLGARTLRADAAPLVALIALMTVWGEV